MKTKFMKMLAAFAAVAVTGTSWAAVAKIGEEEYETLQEAFEAAGTKKVTVELLCDIDLQGSAENQWTPINGFAGTFDGKEHKIKNLYIDGGTTGNKLGFFGSYFNGESYCNLKNFTIENVFIQGNASCAAVFANGTANIDNVHVCGRIEIGCTTEQGWLPGYNSSYFGAIAGNVYARITNCSVKGDGTATSVIGGRQTGGIVGFMGEGSGQYVRNCKVEDIALVGTYCVGGIQGFVHDYNEISDCSVKNVTISKKADDSNADSFGPISGYMVTGNAKFKNNTVDNVSCANPGNTLLEGKYACYPGDVTVYIKNGNDIVCHIYSYSLQSAINDAKEGDVICLAMDINGNVAIPSDKNITIDLMGHSLFGDSNQVAITNNGTLTVKNGKLDGVSGNEATLIDVEKYMIPGATVPEEQVTVPGTLPVQDEDGKAIEGEHAEVASGIASTILEQIGANTIAGAMTGTGVAEAATVSAIIRALNDQVEATVEAASQEATKDAIESAKDDIETFVDVALEKAVVTNTTDSVSFKSIVFDVTPKAKVTVTVLGVEQTITAVIPNSEITSPISFRLPLTDAFTANALVRHEGDADRIVRVQVEAGSRYVELAATHFSAFEVMPTELGETITSTTGASTVLGIKRTEGKAVRSGAETAIGVPWLSATTAGSISVDELVQKDTLATGDKLMVWNGSTYYAWLWRNGAWEAAVGSPDASDYKVQRGAAAWLTRANDDKSLIQVGKYDEAAIATALTVGHNLLINPRSVATPLSAIPGSEGDMLSVTSQVEGLTMLTWVEGGWKRLVFTTTSVKINGKDYTVTKQEWQEPEVTQIPADCGFWIIRKASNGGSQIHWN